VRTGGNTLSKSLTVGFFMAQIVLPNLKSLLFQSRNALPVSEDGERSALQQLPFCKLGSQIDSGFARLCSAVIEHAGESNMDDHFRTGLSVAMEDLLSHRRQCNVCNKGLR
jgi:hypothetical protein